jgi:hypothetical protein
MITLEQFREAQRIIDQYYAEQEEKRKMIENICIHCGSKFFSNVEFELCPNCYV